MPHRYHFSSFSRRTPILKLKLFCAVIAPSGRELEPKLTKG